jgi:hypothetical protein
MLFGAGLIPALAQNSLKNIRSQWQMLTTQVWLTIALVAGLMVYTNFSFRHDHNFQ